MLRLKRVEIQGFKSFCERTELRFNGSGIAAIVGPNGCGKSNLSDAISWVLGEQSAKSLRGSRMEDVIFAGTRDRKPLGLAAVTLTLIDPVVDEPAVKTNGHAPESGLNGSVANGSNGANGDSAHAARPSEITVTRRLFRSGESEYLIDGRLARLRDIQDLFMGTGLGPECYAIIEQGRIGQILSSRPQDRRAVIEEAAGITRFKTKKRLAEARLEGARQNLSRVFDILEEVGRQANSLKRQASKARRYRELRAEMLEALAAWLAGRFRVLDSDASKTAIDLSLATAGVERLAGEVAEQERDQTARREQCYRTEAGLTGERRHLEELRIDAERTRARLESQAQQIGGIEQRLAQSEGESGSLERSLTALRQEVEGQAAEVIALERSSSEARAAVAAKNQEREDAQALLRDREQSIEETRRQVLRLLGEASTLRNQLAQIEEYLAAMERDAARARKEEETASADLASFTRSREEISTQLASRQMRLESLSSQKQFLESELAERKESAATARKELDDLRAEASRVRARRDSLEEILSHRAYTTEAVKGLFTAVAQGQGKELRPIGVLADFVEVEPAYEKAAEEFLHDELEYVVVSSWDQAEQGIDLLRTDLDGRATFLVHPKEGDAVAPGASGELPHRDGIIGRLVDVLRFTNGLEKAPVTLIERLDRCYLVSDRDSARRLAAEYPELWFLAADSVCYHGRAASGGRKMGSGPLALKRELRELKSTVATREMKVEETARLVERLDGDIARLTAELEQLRGLEQQEEKETVALDHQMRKLADEIQRASALLSVARLELERLDKESARSRTQLDENRSRIAEADQARAQAEQQLELTRGEVDSLASRLTALNEAHTGMRVELASLEERQRSAEAVQLRLAGEARELSRRLEEMAAESERLCVERARLLTDNIGLDRRAALLAEQIAAREAAVRSLEEEEQRLRADLESLDESLKQMRGDHQLAQERRSQIEIELVRKQTELKFLDETARKELNAGLDEIAAGRTEIPDELGLAEAEQRHKDLFARIEALGPVNPAALEEYQEAQQRYDFLNTQRQDLIDSIRDTEKAIQDIDVESRKRFSDAFEKINHHFRETFSVLFGGGTGEMRLTDEANLAESGVEIVASPPGKRLQNVLLLSGGEKSLTAMALLMAVFRYQPSPFCVLDEVDAPLDEPNIERLMRLLKEMASQTQFVLITHAKRTMEAAETMYGVTMQEPGVSKLVSVKFKAAPLPEPVTAAAMATQ